MVSATVAEVYGKYVDAEDILGDEEGHEDDGENEEEGKGQESDAFQRGEQGYALDQEATEQAATAGGEAVPLEWVTTGIRNSSEGHVLMSGPFPSSNQADGAGPRDPVPTDALYEAPGAAQPLVLPPATSRGSTSRDSARRSSHLEASTSGLGAAQAPDSLPPIKQRNSQPSRKGSNASSQGAAVRRSQGGSPQPGSPGRTSAGGSRYYQAPPPPPPPPKPKPRERHDVSAVDPLYLQTAVYRTVPNVGRVYDWKLQHEVNQALSKQRKQQAQMEKVMEAARIQLQVREANQRAFQQWVAGKKMEKQQQDLENRRIAYVTSVYRTLARDDPAEQKTREDLWVNNFGAQGPPPGRYLGSGPDGDMFERFRL